MATDVGPGIRLVNLLPGQFEDEIIIDILHADFSAGGRSASGTQQAYETLSYAWGPQENPATIKVRPVTSPSLGTQLLSKLRISSAKRRLHRSLGPAAPKGEGGTLCIGNNLNIALRHVRSPDKGRILWIDAICINQKDVEERNREVARMGEIYSKAARVLIWLGPESENSSLAIRTMRLFAKDLVHDWPPNSINRLSYREPGTKTELLLKSPILWDDETGYWLAIRKLFQRTWFTRLWVYQECQLATDALVVAGHDSIPMPEFFRAGAWFAALSFQTPNILETLRLGAAMSIIFPWDNTLDFLMVMVKNCNCKDPSK